MREVLICGQCSDCEIYETILVRLAGEQMASDQERERESWAV